MLDIRPNNHTGKKQRSIVLCMLLVTYDDESIANRKETDSSFAFCDFGFGISHTKKKNPWTNPTGHPDANRKLPLRP